MDASGSASVPVYPVLDSVKVSEGGAAPSTVVLSAVAEEGGALLLAALEAAA
jgi:hypothetical protein